VVGFETSDDAAVYLLSPETAALLTADFFTPIVDDAFDFGRIAAANALSDIYAMGGRPLCALNLLALPGDLPPEVAIDILRGAGEVVTRAGAVTVGGHTIEDAEPKFGLAVLGTADPGRVVRNIGARAGDALVLTKPIGTGIMTTALKRGLEDETSLAPVVDSMARLNASAADAMMEVGVDAATDVTGFGLVGHLREMALGSGLAAVVDRSTVPLFDGVLEYASDLVCPGRTRDLLDYVAATTDWTDSGLEWRASLTDPQTSGGLLIAVRPEALGALTGALERRGESAAVIGRFETGVAGHVTVR
jgi:selenide, water dikinase